MVRGMIMRGYRRRSYFNLSAKILGEVLWAHRDVNASWALLLDLDDARRLAFDVSFGHLALEARLAELSSAGSKQPLLIGTMMDCMDTAIHACALEKAVRA